MLLVVFFLQNVQPPVVTGRNDETSIHKQSPAVVKDWDGMALYSGTEPASHGLRVGPCVRPSLCFMAYPESRLRVLRSNSVAYSIDLISEESGVAKTFGRPNSSLMPGPQRFLPEAVPSL